MVERVYSADELEVCEEVGRGGFGIVYRGLIKTNNQEVAIKQIDLENDQTDLLEINREIQIISECRIPQITKYLGCFVKNYKLWVIMEFVDGGSLYDILKPGPIVDESLVLIILKEILIALEYLHKQGKIHRDLKSQNVLLNKDSAIKLTDFGVSTQLSSNFSRRNTTVGTPYWMAPEVIMNNNGGHSFKADIWSLGCCAYEMVTGKPPLQNQYPPMKALRQISGCHRNEDFLNLIELNNLQISSTFRDFFNKCFLIDPKQRYSAGKLLNHRFITKYSKTPEKIKATKQLITRKQLWDQDNHIHKQQNYYVPTEIAKNQRKWQDPEKDNHKSFSFDISSIQSEKSPLPVSKHQSNTNESSPRSIVTPSESSDAFSIKQDQITQTVRPEFHRILTKVFHKLESRNNLSTDQYDSIVTLNDNILNLLTFTNNQNQQKVIIFQFLKYLLKELTKGTNEEADNYKSKLTLQRLIIPSNFDFQTNKPQKSPNTTIKGDNNDEFDEIEHSLFESWIDRMGEKRN